MKNIIYPLTAIFLIFFLGCQHNQNEEIEKLKCQIEELKVESQAKDSAINEYFRVLNEIETNITLIMQKEQVIANNAALGKEMQVDTRKRISNDINVINELMSENRQNIKNLSKQLKGANFEIHEFQNRLNRAQTMLEHRNNEIESLKQRLVKLDFSMEALNATVDTLTAEKQLLESKVKRHVEELNTAWYAYGTRKELIENKIAEREGGFLGIGRTIKLRADFNKEYFTKIDLTQTQNIPLFAKKASLVTVHPPNTYELVVNENKIIESIKILDVQSFWSASRYLVILVD